MLRSVRRLRIPRSSLLLITMVVIVVLPLPQPRALASCVAPYLKVDGQLVLEPGTAAVVVGREFSDGCQDSMSCSVFLGCQSCEYDNPPATPLKDVELRLAQGARSWSLGVTDAETAEGNHLGWVTWAFDVPAEAKPGTASLVADHAEPVRIGLR